MVLLKDSPIKEEIRVEYEQLWDKFQNVDESKVRKALEKANFEALTIKEKARLTIQPFKTHLLWIIPVCVVTLVILVYVIIVWVALIVE